MGTVPTNQLERELRKLYLTWLAGVPKHQDDLADYITSFETSSRALVTKLGGQTARLGALADFPVPKTLDLSPRADVVYNDMQQAAIKAGITAGLQSTDVARQMLHAGLDKSFRSLNRLARTETVSAYWKNQWDSVADLPAIVMVWGSEHGHRTCDYCLARDGLVVEDANIRDHPNGRCTLIPTLRSKLQYKGTLQPDGSITMDPRYMHQAVKGAKAQASAGPTTAEQRDTLSGKTNPAAPSQANPQQAVHVQSSPARQWVTLPDSTKADLPYLAPRGTAASTQAYIKDSYDINRGLRTGNMSAKVTRQVEHLDKVTDIEVSQDVKVYRGIGDLTFIDTSYYDLSKVDPTKVIGAVFQDKAFTSTSYGSSAAFDHRRVSMEIVAPAGTKGSTLGNDAEREFLLARNTQFTVVDMEKIGEGRETHIRLKVIVTGQG